MKKLIFVVIALAMFVVISISMLWGALAIWFKLPVPEAWKIAVILAFLLPGFFALVHVFTWKTHRAILIYTVLFGCLIGWWMTITPPTDDDWSPDVAKQVTGKFDGDLLTLTNVREFEWRTKEDFTERWTERTYDLSKLIAVDMFLSYWGDPKIAHFMMSFSFSDGETLAWSVEVRRVKGGNFSPVADFFKGNTLVILASAESDVVGVRSNIRGEDVHMFRLRPPVKGMQELMREYVQDANSLAEKPQWYNSLTTNCTTVVFKMITAFDDRIPLDWRVILNGYLPEYVYGRGGLNTDHTVDELRELGLITERAKANGLNDQFSHAIREGVPVPNR